MIWGCLLILLIRLSFLRSSGTSIPQDLHALCLSWNYTFRLDPLYASLVCGHALPSHHKRLFIDLGIYHWFVASGSHLVLLMQFLKKLKASSEEFLLILLTLYSLMTSWQAPIVRALLQILISFFVGKYELQTTSQQKNLCAGLICLSLQPEWLDSYSLPLSWLCAMACGSSASPWKDSFKISLFILPLFEKWSLLHFLYNVALTPIFSVVLFPLSLLCFLIAPITSMGNHLWIVVIEFLKLVPTDTNPLVALSSKDVLWIYVFTLQLSLILLERVKNA